MYLAPTVGNLVEPATGRVWDPAEFTRQLACRVAELDRLGLRPGDRVFLGYGNRLEFFADLMAVWHSGGVVVPLDARLTPFEVEVLAGAAKPRFFVSLGELDPTLATALDRLGVTVLDLTRTRPGGTHGSSPGFSLDDDALILFTSGTTGNPKGVVHTHRSLRARWVALRDNLGIEAYRRTLCLLPTHFGHGLICNCLFPWLSGQDLFVLPPFSADTIIRLGSILDQHRITFLSSVPSVWRLALKVAPPPKAGTVERVFIGSAPLSGHLWREVQRWAGTRDVCNAYGITETGSWVAGTTMPDFQPEDGLIGVPWGATVAITEGGTIDDCPGSGRLCGPGEVGFIWLNTPALMRGYLDRDDLTSQCVSRGWFLTGDLGCLDDRGRLFLRGRVRDEINRGGAKVYPADIEAVAEQFPGVADLCCFPVDDPNYGQNIGLAVVLTDPTESLVRPLFDWLRQHLGEHQMPVRCWILDAIPRTSRGKVNRSSVAEACQARPPLDLRRLLAP